VRAESDVAALALEFLILTAARTSEVVGARWEEIDLVEAVWTIPAHRIKARREHAPIKGFGDPQELATEQPQEFVFPSAKADTSLSNMALLALLKRMDRTDITAHGFRSTFRDWAAERTNYPR
jgi:integrase